MTSRFIKAQFFFVYEMCAKSKKFRLIHIFFSIIFSLQYQALQESGKANIDGVPLVQVRDILKCLPQLNYMVRSQEPPANKRARIS